jgi:hypothetical protein
MGKIREMKVIRHDLKGIFSDLAAHFFDMKYEIPNDDLIDGMSSFLQARTENLQFKWARSISTSMLSAVSKNVRIYDEEGPVRLNVFYNGIGRSDEGKTLPIETFAIPIIKKCEDKIREKMSIKDSDKENFRLLYPSNFTREAFIKNLDEKPDWQGLVVIDEFISFFKESRQQKHHTQDLEFLSQLYDGQNLDNLTVARGLEHVEAPYVSLLVATNPYFLRMLDPDFFVQGTGNRFLYDFLDIEDYEVGLINPKEYLQSGSQPELDKFIEYYGNILARIYLSLDEYCSEKPYFKLEIETLHAGDFFREFKFLNENIWKEKVINDHLGWNFQYIKRLPLHLLKLAGIYAISSKWPLIVEGKYYQVKIDQNDMLRGIDRILAHIKDTEAIFKIKRAMSSGIVQLSKEEKADLILSPLKNAPNKMLNVAQWYNSQEITRRLNEFHVLKNNLLSRGKIRQVQRKEITDPNEIKYLGLDKSATKVYAIK